MACYKSCGAIETTNGLHFSAVKKLDTQTSEIRDYFTLLYDIYKAGFSQL